MTRTSAFATIIAALLVLNPLWLRGRMPGTTTILHASGHPSNKTSVRGAFAFMRNGINPGFESYTDPASGDRDFVTRRGSMSLALTSTEATWRFGTGAVGVRMHFVGATPGLIPIAVTRLPGVTNNFFGADPAAWRTGGERYAEVTYKEMYPGVDVEYDTSRETLEYSFIVEPHSDPTRIRMRFDGADRIEINAAGDLMVYSAGEYLRQPRPTAYQQSGSSRQSVAVEYTMNDGHTVGIRVGAYDPARRLIIDPLVYSTYLGGSGHDLPIAIAVDDAGNAYVVGTTDSSDFPTLDPLQAATGRLAFVTKFDASGKLVYSTFLGGDGLSQGNGIAIDAFGDVYIAGVTSSTNFPTTSGAFQVSIAKSCGGIYYCPAGFIVKLSATGALLYSTYLGGNGGDYAAGIAVGATGEAYVTGATNSRNFPVTPGALQSRWPANCLARLDSNCLSTFVTRLNAAGNALIYSTYLGGDTATYTYNDGTAIAVDSEGSAYVVGRTEGFSFPTTAGAFQPAFGELFVTKLNPTGTALAYSSYLGGLKTLVPVPPNPSDPIPISWATGIAVDGGGNAYVAGGTYAFDHITTPGAAFPNAPGVGPSGGIGPYSDAFITKINPSGTALGYSTYLGGTGQDSAGGIAVNPAGRAYVTGWTTSGDFPVTDSVQGAPTQNSGCVPFPCTDVFTTTLAADGSAVEYSTYLGGSGSDLGSGIAVDGAGAVYVIGRTTSDDFPNVNAFQSQNHGANVDAFVAKLIPAAASAVIGLRFDRQNVLAGGSYSATVSGSDLFTSQTFFDVRFTAPGRDADVALNWQRGLGASHAVSVGTSPGTWTITGVRPHQLETDHTAGFVPVLASITISP